ncbi:MAG: hypothetical protein P0121_01265 [Nitrospira sp.]|nr:hypothetical protein [Nitrospira sp.]
MIVSYTPEAVEPSQPSTKAGIAGFFFYTGAVGDPNTKDNSLPIEFRLIQEALENKGGFAAATVSNPPSAKGIHLNVYETVIEQSTASNIFCSLSLLTLSAVPCYSSRGGYLVQYDLLVDGELKKTYRYELHEKRAQWIVLLPVMWMNGLTVSYQQAFRGTIYQFLRDGQADGYLPVPSAPTSQVR